MSEAFRESFTPLEQVIRHHQSTLAWWEKMVATTKEDRLLRLRQIRRLKSEISLMQEYSPETTYTQFLALIHPEEQINA